MLDDKGKSPSNLRRKRRDRRRDGLLTTGDMARMSNSTLRTVRFYEEAHILHPISRSEGGHRLFTRTELEKLLLVTDMRAAGLSLDEIKTILELKKSSKTGVQASAKVGEFLVGQLEQMQRKAEALRRLQEDFTAASQVFSTCKHCEQEEGFPTRCATCGVMGPPASLPRSVRVLWGLGAAD